MAPGGLEACRVGETRASPVDLRAAQGGEGQATFFVDAGILTSDFPCSAGGRSPEQRASELGRASSPGCRSQDARGQRPTAGGLRWPCRAVPLGPGCRGLAVSHPSHNFLIPARGLLSHVAAGLGTLKIAAAGPELLLGWDRAPPPGHPPSSPSPGKNKELGWGRGAVGAQPDRLSRSLPLGGPRAGVPLPHFLPPCPLLPLLPTAPAGAPGPPRQCPLGNLPCECEMGVWPLVQK